MRRFRDPIIARGRMLSTSVGLPQPPADCTIDEFLVHLVDLSGTSAQTRSVVLLAAMTGRYPTEAQVLDLQPWVAVGSLEHVRRIVDDAVRRTPHRALARPPVLAPGVVVDVTRTARAITMSGIPRVARAVAQAAQENGGAAIAWADGVPGIVNFDEDGHLTFVHPARSMDSWIARATLLLKRTYWWALNVLAGSNAGYRFAASARATVSPLGARLFDRNGSTEMLVLADCRYVLPEVTLADTSARLLPWLKCGTGVHVTIGVHDLLPINNPRFFHPDQRLEHIEFSRVIARADEIVVASPHLEEEIDGLRAVFGSTSRGRLHMIPYGGGTGSSVLERRKLPQRDQFLMIGAMEPRKNHALVLRALGLLAASGRPTTLHLVGAHRPASPDTRDAVKYAQASGVRVIDHSAADDATVQRIADGCAALFYPSFDEGYGLPVIEALSMGMPVIASDIPSNRAHLTLGGLVLVPADDPRALAAEVLAIMDEDDHYVRLLASIEADKIPAGYATWIDALLDGVTRTATARLTS